MERLRLGLTGGFAIALIGIWIAAIIGWVMNVIKMIGTAVNGFGGNEIEVIIRAVGVFFAPLGAVAGYF